MGEVRLSIPPASVPIAEEDGRAPKAWRRFLEGVFFRLGGATDNVFAALAASLGAVTNTTEIVASGGLQFGGALDGNIPIAFYKGYYLVADLPTTGNARGIWAFATNGRKNGEGAGSGTGTPVWWDETSSHWKAVDTGATVAA